MNQVVRVSETSNITILSTIKLGHEIGMDLSSYPRNKKYKNKKKETKRERIGGERTKENKL
jgi:hypothetical protein